MDETERNIWIGFDLGGTKMMAVAYDSEFQMLGKKRRRTRGTGESGKSRIPLDRLAETIRKALEDAEVGPERLAGIGAGCPGPLDLEAGIIKEAPNLGWKDVRLQEFFEKEFGCPAVICNDVDAGVFGEYQRGAGQGGRCVLGVFPGTGVGGGCVYEGRIFRGRRTSCMEVGFLQMATAGAAAGVGPEGTLEGLASRLTIAGEAAKAVYRGQAPALKEIAGTDLSEIRSGALARAIEAGDAAIERIVANAAHTIGNALGSLVNILAPDIIVLGGGLVEAMPELYLRHVKRGIDRNVLPSLADVAKVREAELGDYAATVGAAALIMQAVRARD